MLHKPPERDGQFPGQRHDADTLTLAPGQSASETIASGHSWVASNRGFWMALPWQGRGLMTEAAEAVTDCWFDVRKFPVPRVPKAAANLASRRQRGALGVLFCDG